MRRERSNGSFSARIERKGRLGMEIVAKGLRQALAVLFLLLALGLLFRMEGVLREQNRIVAERIRREPCLPEIGAGRLKWEQGGVWRIGGGGDTGI